MPLSDREYIRGTHPPTCTCAICCAKRLVRQGFHPSVSTRAIRRFSANKVLIPLLIFSFLIIAVGVLLLKPDIPWPVFPKEATPPSLEAPPINPTPPLPAEPKQNKKLPQESRIKQVETQTFEFINTQRQKAGVPSTKWDNKLYELSKSHTQKMASQGELFHSPGMTFGENCWGGDGYYYYGEKELAKAIVNCWLSSPLHRAWLLHEPIQTSVVTIVLTPSGQYASWAFWMDEVNQGPELIRKIADEWENETNKEIPWLDWLQRKGYID